MTVTKKEKILNILFYGFIAILIIIASIGLILLLIREIKATREDVEITVTIGGTEYKEPYRTIQYNAATKTSRVISHDAEYKTYFTYEDWTIISKSEYIYNYAYSRINSNVKIKAIKIIYEDGEVKYQFVDLILN